jgi:hypothetical protein
MSDNNDIIDDDFLKYLRDAINNCDINDLLLNLGDCLYDITYNDDLPEDEDDQKHLMRTD